MKQKKTIIGGLISVVMDISVTLLLYYTITAFIFIPVFVFVSFGVALCFGSIFQTIRGADIYHRLSEIEKAINKIAPVIILTLVIVISSYSFSISEGPQNNILVSIPPSPSSGRTIEIDNELDQSVLVNTISLDGYYMAGYQDNWYYNFSDYCSEYNAVSELDAVSIIPELYGHRNVLILNGSAVGGANFSLTYDLGLGNKGDPWSGDASLYFYIPTVSGHNFAIFINSTRYGHIYFLYVYNGSLKYWNGASYSDICAITAGWHRLRIYLRDRWGVPESMHVILDDEFKGAYPLLVNVQTYYYTSFNIRYYDGDYIGIDAVTVEKYGENIDPESNDEFDLSQNIWDSRLENYTIGPSAHFLDANTMTWVSFSSSAPILYRVFRAFRSPYSEIYDVYNLLLNGTLGLSENCLIIPDATFTIINRANYYINVTVYQGGLCQWVVIAPETTDKSIPIDGAGWDPYYPYYGVTYEIRDIYGNLLTTGGDENNHDSIIEYISAEQTSVYVRCVDALGSLIDLPLFYNGTAVDNVFSAPIGSYVNISVMNVFGSIIDEKVARVNRSLNEITFILDIYDLTIKNDMLESTNITIYHEGSTFSMGIIKDNIKTLSVAAGPYSLTYVDDSGASNSIELNITGPTMLILNSTFRNVYFSVFDESGLGVDRDLFRLYINGARRDWGYVMCSDTSSIRVLDYFGAELYNEDVYLAHYTEFNIYLPVYTLLINNNYTESMRVKIYRDSKPDYALTNVIPAQSAISYRFLANITYSIEIYYTNGTLADAKQVVLDRNNKILSFGYYSKPITNIEISGVTPADLIIILSIALTSTSLFAYSLKKIRAQDIQIEKRRRVTVNPSRTTNPIAHIRGE